MEYLVGYTGFVGSNLDLKHEFDGKFNSKNYTEAFGKNPDLLVYSGIPAQKFLANKFPEKDMQVIDAAKESIKAITPKTLVLISTIDVYKDVCGVDENSEIETEDLHAYGLNRYRLEQWVLENKSLFEKVLIVRLPGLYGANLKKNFIYDLIHIIPAMLNEAKYVECSGKSEFIKKFYVLQDNGFYKCMADSKADKDALKEEFLAIGFTALNFTDSRASFQFYNLENLYGHIEEALKNDIELLNIATEPITASDVYNLVYDDEFVNEFDRPAPDYDFRTIYADKFGGKDGYIYSKREVLDDIKKYLEANR